MSLTNFIGIAAGILTAISLLPQLIKIAKEKKAENISTVYLFVLLGGLALWVFYGVLRQDLPIIITNSASAVLNIAIIVLGFKYKQQ